MSWHLFDTNYNGDAQKRIDLYPLAYEAMISAMFEEVDSIMQRNPNAIVVLQSDHGLHRTT